MAQITIKNKTFIIPESDSPCDLWKSYFTQLKSEMGQENARTIWLVTWGERGAISCTTNPAFNKWLGKEGINVSNAGTRAIADLSSIGSNILGFSKNMTRMISIGAPILLGGISLAILLVLINTAKKSDITDVAALHPVGKAAKLGQGLKLLNQ
ncbi:MAG: hypothetical protein JXQ90_18415 [Cyclobacteriaceae bacterium]